MHRRNPGVRLTLLVVFVLIAVPVLAVGSAPPSSPVAPPSITAPLSPMGPAYAHIGATMAADLAVLHAAYPSLTRFSIAGYTVEENPIVKFVIGNFAVPEDEVTSLYVDGTVHGNEVPGSEVIYWGARKILEGYGSDPRMTRLVDEHRIVMLPLVNVDGNMDARRTNANLVDLNRNFPWKWCEQPGASPTPGHPTYCGTAPASEPETQTMMEVIDESQAQIVITMHSGTIELLYPWGYTTTAAPDHTMFVRMGDAFQAHTGFRHSSALYPVTGATRDWVYGTYGVPAFTYEVDHFQNTQAIFQSPQSWEVRLAVAIEGMFWLLDNARFMGAWVGVPQGEPALGGTAISFAYGNDGWGDTTVHYTLEVVDAPLAEGTTGSLFVDAESSNTAVWSLQVTGDGSGTVTLLAEYDRTKLHARPLELEATYLVTVQGGVVTDIALQ